MSKFDDAGAGYPFLTGLIKTKAEFYTSDSRQAGPEAIFIALPGRQSDGHDYIESLRSRSLAAIVLEKAYAEKYPEKILGFGDTEIVEVENSHHAHRHLAHEFRKKSNAIVVAVGGSAGKTTTKDFIFDLVSPHKNTFKTQASQNGHLGIPKTFEQLRPHHEVAVIEIGIDDIGDMQKHVELVEPDIAVLTSIGEEHLNLLKNIETVFVEEKKLIEWTLKRGRTAIVPEKDLWLSKIPDHPKLIRVPSHIRELFPSADTPFWGDHVNQNLSLAIRVGLSIGLNEVDMLADLGKLQVPEGRGRIEKIDDQRLVVADYYNSNPDSLQAGLKSFDQHPQFQGVPKTLILGDMFDLGESTVAAHQSVVEAINALKPEVVILVGAEMNKIAKLICAPQIICFASTDEAVRGLDQSRIQKGAIFLKASRGMYFEKILNALHRKD